MRNASLNGFSLFGNQLGGVPVALTLGQLSHTLRGRFSMYDAARRARALDPRLPERDFSIFRWRVGVLKRGRWLAFGCMMDVDVAKRFAEAEVTS
jgi:hypothetical protein